MLQKIKTKHPNFKNPNLDVWSKDINLAIKVDGRTADELEQCIDWIYSQIGAAFWQKNILSGAKLRKNFDTMFMQAQASQSKMKTQNVVDNLYGSGYTATQVLTAMGASNV